MNSKKHGAKYRLCANKNEHAITLVALVVTIVVTLILASITIAAISSNNSVPEKAKQARDAHDMSILKEQIETAVLNSAEADGDFNLSDVKNAITNSANNVTFLNDEFPLKVAMNNEVICTVFDDGTTGNFEIKEYIKSTGTQYIDTGVNPANTVDFEMTFKTDVDSMTVTRNNGHEFFGYGSVDINRKISFHFSIPRDSKRIYIWKNNTASSGAAEISFSTTTYNPLNKIKISCINDVWKVNNSTVGTSESVGLWKDEHNSLIVCGYSVINNNVKTIYPFYENMYLYSLKIWDNGTIIRDFIPVVSFENGHENEACLYDLVNNEFYYNAGEGTFETN